jgi:peptide/nickel transport system substrate-binding protein
VLEEPCCIDALDPVVTGNFPGYEATQNIYQGLLAYAPNSSKLVPLLAQSYNISADGLTYTFKLRQNITFSNGDPLNSYVIWYSIYRDAIMAQYGAGIVTIDQNMSGVTASMLNQFTTATPPQSLLQIMQNAKNAIVTPSPYVVVFHLKLPFSPFLATLTSPEHTAVDPVVVSANGGVVAGQTNSWMSLNAMGTGPFMATQYQPNTQLTLVRNPKYWGGVGNVGPTPRVQSVIIKYTPSALTRVEDVQRGTAQMAYVDPALVAQSVAAGGLYIPNIGAVLTVDYIPLDTQKFPFNNVLIRQAVAHDINYTAVRKLFFGFEKQWVGPNPQGIVGYDPNLKPYSYNVTLARQLLAQAGYANGQGIPTVSLYAATDSPPTPDVAVVVQSNLADIGIKVKIVAEPYASILPLLSASPTNSSYPDMVPQAWFYFPDPWAFTDSYLGPSAYGSQNVGWYNNTAVNNLLTQAGATTNQTKRNTIYQQVAQIVYNDSPDIWLGQRINTWSSGVPILSTSVGGYILNMGYDGTDFSHLYLTH